jgi:hypothetical protein
LRRSYFARDDARKMQRNKTGSDERNEFVNSSRLSAGHRLRSRSRYG